MIPQVERLFSLIKERGWMGRIIPIGHIADLQEAIQSHYRNGFIRRGTLSRAAFFVLLRSSVESIGCVLYYHRRGAYASNADFLPLAGRASAGGCSANLRKLHTQDRECASDSDRMATARRLPHSETTASAQDACCSQRSSRLRAE